MVLRLQKERVFPGKILIVTHDFWSGISMPNDQLKEAVKTLGYLLLGDKENAVKQIIGFCQTILADMVHNLHLMHYYFKLDYMGLGLIDDYDIMGGIHTRVSRILLSSLL